MMYFRKSEELARKFDKGTVKELYYLGEKEDIHCIVDKNRKNTDACTVTGVIHNIRNNKGILKMKCGIEVSFNAKGFDILHDEGQTLKGTLGFSYSGPGLYDFRPDSDNELTGLYMNMQEEKEISFEELGESYLPAEDLVEEINLEEAPSPSSINIKQVGFIDLGKSTSNPKRQKVNKEKDDNTLTENINNTKYQNGEISHGKIDLINGKVKGEKGPCTIDKDNGYAINCSPREYDYRDFEEVIFEVKVRTHKLRPQDPWYYANNIRPASEE